VLIALSAVLTPAYRILVNARIPFLLLDIGSRMIE